MLNFNVYNQTAHRTVVPWRIHKVTPPDVTFRGFYHEQGTRFVEGGSSGPSATQLELNTTFVGSSKEHLDQVDADLRVSEVIGTFGPYAKFLVEEIEAFRRKLYSLERQELFWMTSLSRVVPV